MASNGRLKPFQLDKEAAFKSSGFLAFNRGKVAVPLQPSPVPVRGLSFMLLYEDLLKWKTIVLSFLCHLLWHSYHRSGGQVPLPRAAATTSTITGPLCSKSLLKSIKECQFS